MNTDKKHDEASSDISKSLSLVETPPPFTSHFFDQTAAAAKARLIYYKIMLFRTIIIVIALFAIFSIYWGALFEIPARSLQGWIVDFDGDLIGQIVSTELAARSGKPISWHIQPPSQFPNGPSDVALAVVEESCWVAVVVNPEATKKLNASLSTAAGYNASQAVTAFGAEARNENAFRTLLKPTMDASLQQITYDYAVHLAKELLSNTTTLATISPDILVRPVYYTIDNIRPFDKPVATAVTYIGLIYLVILAFFVVNSGIIARNASGLENRLTTTSLMYIRIISPIIMYCVLACTYGLVTLAFDLPFNRRFGRPGFLVFWMLAWFGMTACGLAMETMTTLLTIKYIQIFLILWIIANISICLWPLEAMPVVYSYGFAAPFYQITRGVRTIVFSTKNERLNFGILIVWIVISCITLFLVQLYRRRETIEVWRKQQGKVRMGV